MRRAGGGNRSRIRRSPIVSVSRKRGSLARSEAARGPACRLDHVVLLSRKSPTSIELRPRLLLGLLLWHRSLSPTD
jgi:hypothetical protein